MPSTHKKADGERGISVRNALILLSCVKNDISRQDQLPMGGFSSFQDGEPCVCIVGYP